MGSVVGGELKLITLNVELSNVSASSASATMAAIT